MLGFECVWVDEGTIVLWMFGERKKNHFWEEWEASENEL